MLKGSKKPMSKLALASRRANLLKARAAGREKIYRPTEKRQAASRANMARAIAARKSVPGNASARLNALSHGISVKDVAGSVARMGEDPREYWEHHALFERIFVPQDDAEEAVVRGLADTSWKRLRFLRAQAEWELGRLKKAFPRAGRTGPLGAPAIPIDAEETRLRADALCAAIEYSLDYLDYVDTFQLEIQSGLRKLLKFRSGGQLQYRFFTRMSKIRDELDMPMKEWVDAQLKSKKMSPKF